MSLSTQIVPRTGVHTVSASAPLPPSIITCRSNFNSAATCLYAVPQFAVTDAGAVIVTMCPLASTARSSNTSPTGSYDVALYVQSVVSKPVTSSSSKKLYKKCCCVSTDYCPLNVGWCSTKFFYNRSAHNN
jgi:hypothetical protein